MDARTRWTHWIARVLLRAALSGGSALVFGFAVTPALAATVTVTTTADTTDVDGAVSLREAIASVNAGTDLNADVVGVGAYGTNDRIEFSIPGSGVRTISVSTGGLPAIGRSVTIDGYSQPGSSPNTLAVGNDAVLLVEVNGANSGSSVAGLTVNADNATVRGLVVNGFADGTAISVLSAGAGTTIAGNFIGTDASGTTVILNGHVFYANKNGITIDNAPDVTIGGTTPAARNLVSGHRFGSGILVSGAGASAAKIQGNYVGTNANGLEMLPNDTGVKVDGAPYATVGGRTTGARNVISGNSGNGVWVRGVGARNPTVQGNYVGINARGSTALRNGCGIQIQHAPNALVGGTGDGDRNIVSGNLSCGILVAELSATGAVVQGNYVGLDPTGTVLIRNGGAGIGVSDAPGVSIGGVETGARNVVAGSGIGVGGSYEATGTRILGNFVGTDWTGTVAFVNDSGIGISARNVTVGGTAAGSGNVIAGGHPAGITVHGVLGSGAVIQGNHIGTDVTGTRALGNVLGISVTSEVLGSLTIGGNVPGARNVISGNVRGIALTGTYGSTIQIQGNYIGTNAAGTAAIGNETGIQVETGAQAVIGGTAPGSGNLISGNVEGIRIVGGDAAGLNVQGNRIGTNAVGTGAIANGTGIVIRNARGATIGGTADGAGNVIAYNTSVGVGMVSTGNATDRNVVRGNAIFANGGLGIDLKQDGVSLNDDFDFGPNNLQNFPVLTSANGVGSTTHVAGTLRGIPATNFAIDVYASPACDSLGHGEGQTYLGAVVATTDKSGNAVFVAQDLPHLAEGTAVTATATDPNGNTSEFSSCKAVTLSGAFTITPTSGLVTTEAGGTASFTVKLNSIPSAPVTIPVSSSDITEGTVSVASLTFAADATALNPQKAIVTGVSDALADGDVGFTIVLGSAASADAAYHRADPADVSVVNRDDAPIACTPRPNVTIVTANSGDGRLRVTVEATTRSPSAQNRLRQLQFDAGTNANVQIPGQPTRTGPFTYDIPNGPTSFTFYVGRQAAGAPTHLPFRVVDGCTASPWSTFVGGGASAF